MRFLFSRLSLPARIAGTYAVLTGLWIMLGNGAVARYLGDPNRDWRKGLVFVVVSAGIIHFVVKRLIARFEADKAALRASDERWKFAMEGAGDGVWDWNAEIREVFYSPRWKAILGYAESEIGHRAEEWGTRIHPEDRAHVRRQFKRHYLGQTPAYVCEHRLRTKDGTYKWVLARGQIVRRSAAGRPLRAIGTHSDISARKEGEARVADALAFNETILRSAPIGIFTYRASGETVSLNEEGARIIGADAASLIRVNFRQIESWRRHGLVELADRALKENTVISHATVFVSTFGRSSWCEMRFAPFVYEGEQRLLLIMQDTTKQRAMLERLELLHAALDAAPTGWVVTDAEGVIEWVNPGFSKLTGYTLEEAVGRKPSLLKSGRHPPAFYANLWQTIKEGRIWQGEICNRRKDGTLYFERTTIAPVRAAGGAIAHFVAMKENITGQRELEQQLARSHRLESIGLIASGIAHDLNNVLSPILLAVGLVKEEHSDRPTRELLDMMQGAAQRGASIVQQVLTFARGVEGERVRLDVRPLVKEVVQLARETFPREIRIMVEVPAGELFVEGDVTPLHQVLLNLAVNARDAMPEGGTLTLKAQTAKLDEAGAGLTQERKPGNYVKLTVADTGTESPEVLDHIFEPFFTTKPRGKGTGLGLSTVYGIVRSLGGFVDVASTMGTGTEFSVWLPASAVSEAASALPVKVAPPLAGAGRRILVVDDEVSIRRVTARILERRGFIAVEAEDGAQVLDRLRAEPGGFYAAILDLMMPGMNGYKLVREIRQIAPALPIVVATGMMGPTAAGEDRATLTELGVRTVLLKPFAESDLLEALNF